MFYINLSNTCLAINTQLAEIKNRIWNAGQFKNATVPFKFLNIFYKDVTIFNLDIVFNITNIFISPP